jgi:hypothetical protein
MSEIQPYGYVPDHTDERGILQNPVSLIGATKRIYPLGYGSHGWLSYLRWTGVVMLVILAWAGVLSVYLSLSFIPVLWIGWFIYTTRRRHFIYDQRRYRREIGR